jgi:hypothetical protein
MITTIKNSNGEKIHVQYENGEIFVHHEDFSHGYVSLSFLFCNCLLSQEEVLEIYATCLRLHLEANK